MKTVAILLVLSLGVLSNSCNKDSAVVNIVGKDFGKVAFAMTSVPVQISKVVARLTRSGFENHVLELIVSDSGRNASGVMNNIDIGIWHLRVDALDDSGIVKYSAETDVEMFSGQTSRVDLDLVLTTGSLEIHVTWGGPCTPPPDGLVAWWAGDGNTNDLTGGPAGELLGDVAYASGQVGKGFQFGGVNGRITIHDAPKFKLTGSLSIEMWIKIFSFPHYHGNIIFFRGDDRPGGFDSFIMGLSTDGQIGFGIYSADSSVGIQTPVASNSFVHVAATLDSVTGSMRIYLNGALAVDSTTALRPQGDLDSNYNPGIGIGNTQGYNYNYPFNGIIDEVSLYSRALSQAEIQRIYQANRSGKCK